MANNVYVPSTNTTTSGVSLTYLQNNYLTAGQSQQEFLSSNTSSFNNLSVTNLTVPIGPTAGNYAVFNNSSGLISQTGPPPYWVQYGAITGTFSPGNYSIFVNTGANYGLPTGGIQDGQVITIKDQNGNWYYSPVSVYSGPNSLILGPNFTGSTYTCNQNCAECSFTYNNACNRWSLSSNVSVSQGPMGPTGPGNSLIQRITLASGTGTVTFASIPQTYNDLRITVMGRCSDAANVVVTGIRFQNDSGNDYFSQLSQGSGSSNTAASYQNTYGYLNYFPGANSGAGAPGFMEIIIPAYTQTTFNKCYSSSGGFSCSNGTSAGVWTGSWTGTSNLTSVSIIDSSGGNFNSGSQFSLYGY
jgi:hypothetical protein